ncbi:hypothetical protein, partial [Gluconobacter oxydans]
RLQNMDFRARKIHHQSNPSNPGTKHLGSSRYALLDREDLGKEQSINPTHKFHDSNQKNRLIVLSIVHDS